ncbi:Hpt domain-containing protein [Alishewanella longhuensis]
MDMAFARQVFVEETEELLALIGSSLLDEHSGKAKDDPQINDIFRAVHTIKGSAALFGFETLVNYCHELENLLQQARDAELAVNQDFCQLLFEAYIYLQQQLLVLQQGEVPIEDAAYLHQLARFKAMSVMVPDATEPVNLAKDNRFSLVFYYSPQLFHEGADPAEHILFLQSQGEVSDIQLTPDFQSFFDPLLCYWQLSLTLQTSLSREQLQASFQFLPDASRLDIQPVAEGSTPIPFIAGREQDTSRHAHSNKTSHEDPKHYS